MEREFTPFELVNRSLVSVLSSNRSVKVPSALFLKSMPQQLQRFVDRVTFVLPFRRLYAVHAVRLKSLRHSNRFFMTHMGYACKARRQMNPLAETLASYVKQAFAHPMPLCNGAEVSAYVSRLKHRPQSGSSCGAPREAAGDPCFKSSSISGALTW